jgi:hypothetical protein
MATNAKNGRNEPLETNDSGIDWTGFDIPERRRRDWRWLLRNLWIRNSDHPRLAEVIDQVKSNARSM